MQNRAEEWRGERRRREEQRALLLTSGEEKRGAESTPSHIRPGTESATRYLLGFH